MAITQSHFRFGIDEGSESTHGWYAAEDTSLGGAEVSQIYAAVLPKHFLLRFCLQANATGLSNIDAEFQFRVDGGAWTNITTSSSPIAAIGSPFLTNGANTTQRLSGTGTFEATSAGVTEDGIAGGNSLDIVANGNAEVLCSCVISNESAFEGGLVEFRLTRDGGTLLDSYAVTPSFRLPHNRFPQKATTTLAGAAASLALAVGLGLGSLSVTGHAPTLVFDSPGGQTIDVPAGSLIFKGPARPFEQIAISPPAAALRFMGPQIAGPTIGPPRDELFLTGLAPSVSATTAIGMAPANATLALTGQTAGVGFNGPEIGILTLTGPIPESVQEGTIALPMTAGALTFTGRQISVAFGKLPQPDALILTGLAPTLQRTYLTVPGAGTLTLTGTTSGLAHVLPVPARSLTLAGLAPDGQRTYLSVPGAGALQLSSFPALLAIVGGNPSPIIPVDPALIGFTGRAPNTAVDASVPVGTLALTGRAPSLGFGSYPAAGALTIGSFKPELEVVHPAPDALVLTGYAPTLAHVIPVGRATLTLTGYAPTLPFRAEPTDQVLQAGARKRTLMANARKRLLVAARRRN